MAGRPRKHVPLDVFINGRSVGQLGREPSGSIDFQYASAWLGWKNTFPVSLSLPLREDRYIGAPVVAVFDNLLPDNNEIRKRLAARAQRLQELQPVASRQPEVEQQQLKGLASQHP